MNFSEPIWTRREKLLRKSNILIAIAVVTIVVIVGVLAGVLSANKERDKCDERVAEAKLEARKKAEGSTTPKPAKTTPKPAKTTMAPTSTVPKQPWDSIRLPSDIRPTHYSMLIKTDLKNLRFTGNSNISINVDNSTKVILFHINQVKIDGAEVQNSKLATLNIARQFYSVSNQFYVLEMASPLDKGPYALKLEFSANMSTKELNGFYNSTYKDENGNTRYVFAKANFFPCDCRLD